MASTTEQNDEKALVLYTHSHHEDLVDHHDSRPFFRGMKVEGTDLEVICVGTNLKHDFNYRRQYTKHFMAARLAAIEAYGNAMAYANNLRGSREHWYFARRYGRYQERQFKHKTAGVIRELSIMIQIIELLIGFHEDAQPDFDIFNTGTVLAVICFAVGLVLPDAVLATVLLGSAVGHMIIVLIPGVVHLFLAVMLDEIKASVEKIREDVKNGDATEAGIAALDDWLFNFIDYVSPEDIGFVNIVI
ncbi:hypothetical protein N0V84_007226 [Fusarium piperis]|uniref:Uncharacterized protein n=1 Tax=Fusarium piperis TaxID=1435070 RepID=A0A9W8WAF6_9HYPO|nr:hypothetical protein N0V84_007226 [Fusarium piperis]